MEQAEIFELLGVHTTEDPIFTTLQTLGFTQMGVQVIPGSRWRGTQDKGEIVFERHAWDRLMERFDDRAAIGLCEENSESVKRAPVTSARAEGALPWSLQPRFFDSARVTLNGVRRALKAHTS